MQSSAACCRNMYRRACSNPLQMLKATIGLSVQRGTSVQQSSRQCERGSHSAASSRYQPMKIKQLPVRVQERMHVAEDRSGFIPNLMTKYSHRPKEYEAFYDHYDSLMHKDSGNLTRVDREMIALVTSTNNNCLYCVVTHSGLHRKYSKRPDLTEQLVANWRHADLSGKEKAILALSTAVCNSEDIKPEHFEDLKKHGLDDEDAWDIAALTSFLNMSTRMVHFTGVRPNIEYYGMGRPKK